MRRRHCLIPDIKSEITDNEFISHQNGDQGKKKGRAKMGLLSLIRRSRRKCGATRSDHDFLIPLTSRRFVLPCHEANVILWWGLYARGQSRRGALPATVRRIPARAFLCAPWSHHGFLIPRSSVLEKKTHFFNIHRFFGDELVLTCVGKTRTETVN